MGIKNRKPVKEVAPPTGSALFLVGVDDDYVGKKAEPDKKKKSLFQEETAYEPNKMDIAKFKDTNFASDLFDGLDVEQIDGELVAWGFNCDKLVDPLTNEIDQAQADILNDYIDENADYKSLTIVDILTVIILKSEIDISVFKMILNEKNADLLELDLAKRFHKRSDVGGATAFLQF